MDQAHISHLVFTKISKLKGFLRSDSKPVVFASRLCYRDESCTQLPHCACSGTWFRSRTGNALFHFRQARLPLQLDFVHPLR